MLCDVITGDPGGQGEYTRIEFVDDSKLEGGVDMLEDRAAIQRDLGKLGSWPKRKLTSFSYKKSGVFLAEKIHIHQY